MAVTAHLADLDGFVSLRIMRSANLPELVEDEPDGWDARVPFYLLWDAEKLARGDWELYTVKAHLAPLAEQHLALLDRLDLPRVDVPEAGLADVSVADALRWAKRRYAAGQAVA